MIAPRIGSLLQMFPTRAIIRLPSHGTLLRRTIAHWVGNDQITWGFEGVSLIGKFSRRTDRSAGEFTLDQSELSSLLIPAVRKGRAEGLEAKIGRMSTLED